MTTATVVQPVSHYAEHFEQYRKVLARLARFDLRMFQIPKAATILDVGCGFGDDLRQLRALGYQAVRGIEADAYCVGKRGELDIQQGSIFETGCPSASVDAVLVSNVFHHTADYEPALIELHRILRLRGNLCFIEPRNSWWRRSLDVVTFHTSLPRLLGGALKCRYAVMGEEIATGLYPQWLRSHQTFFELLDRYFRVEWLRRNLFFWFCKAEKRG